MHRDWDIFEVHASKNLDGLKAIFGKKKKKKSDIKGNSCSSSEEKRSIEKDSIILENTYITMNRMLVEYEQ